MVPKMRPKAPKPLFPPPDRPLRLLLVRLSALGDVLHALPTLAALRRRLPAARIDWVVEDRAAGFLSGRQDLTRIVVFPRSRLAGGGPRARGRALRAFWSDLRAEHYDAVLDLQGNFKSGAIARAARASWRYGWDRRAAREANQVFHQRHYLPPSGAGSKVERNLALAGAVLGEPLAYAAPPMPVDPQARQAARVLCEAAGLPHAGAVLLHPGTSGFGAFKRWPAPHYGALARRLAAAGHAVGVTHGPGEHELALTVARASGGVARPLAPGDLAVLAEVLRAARLVIGGDTGPLHLAALLGTPLLGVFGPKDPRTYGPYGLRADGTPGPLAVVVQQDVACRPCSLRRCDAPLCLTTLEPDRVFAQARRLLGAADLRPTPA